MLEGAIRRTGAAEPGMGSWMDDVIAKAKQAKQQAIPPAAEGGVGMRQRLDGAVNWAKENKGMATAGAIGTGALGYMGYQMLTPDPRVDGIAQQQIIQTQVREQAMGGGGGQGYPGGNGGIPDPAQSLNAAGGNPLPTAVWLKERQRTAKDYNKALDEARVAAFYNKQLGGQLGMDGQDTW